VVLSSSIHENARNSSFVVYPNPVSEGFRIRREVEAEAEVKVEVLNAFGDVVFYEDNYSGNEEVRVIGLPPGLYFVRIIKEQSITTQKMIKQ
jgi:hypothetical protein